MKVTPMNENKYDKYCVENALRTLKEAAEIKKDKKMMKLVIEAAKKEQKDLASIIPGFSQKMNKSQLKEAEEKGYLD